MLRSVYVTVTEQETVMCATDQAQYVGIDVGKAELAVAVLPSDLSFTVSNDAPGWAALCARLHDVAPVTIVLEATGSYHVGAWLALADAALPPAVIDPGRTHAFAKSEGQRTKTDRHDARLLARFGQQKQPTPTALPSATIRTLRDLVACRDDLTTMLVAEQNREQTVTTPLVIELHQTLMTDLAAKVVQVEQAITELIATDPDLAARRRVLQTVPGIGPVLSAVLVAGLPELGLYDAKALASLAGVAPHPRDSGTRHGKRTIGGGRPAIRKALYQMAFSATRWDPVMHAHYLQLCQRRPPKVARIACARRMLGILTSMLRDGLTWQETRVAQGQFLPPTA
jgi:transposase